MLRDLWIAIQSKFVDPEEVAAYNTAIPAHVNFYYKKDGKYYIGYIKKIGSDEVPGLLITQGETKEEFITNLNQLVYSYIRMPEKIRPFYGNRFEVTQGSELKKSGEMTLSKA